MIRILCGRTSVEIIGECVFQSKWQMDLRLQTGEHSSFTMTFAIQQLGDDVKGVIEPTNNIALVLGHQQLLQTQKSQHLKGNAK